MIIWGSRNTKKTLESGRFHCPRCGPEKSFDLISVNRWFTLYFIPLIPLGSVGNYIQCRACAGTFDSSARNYDPAAAQAQFRREFDTAVIRSLAIMALAGPAVTDNTLEAISDIMARSCNRAVEIDDIRPVVAHVASQKLTMKIALTDIGSQLSEDGRAIILNALIALVPHAAMTKDQRRLFESAGNALGYRVKDLGAVTTPALA